MVQQFTGYGYPYPEPTDPVRDGATNIANLAQRLRPNAEAFPGQPPIAGSYAAADMPYFKTVYFNYRIATDQFGLATIPTSFSKCLLWAYCVPTDFRLDVAPPTMAMEGMTNVAQVAWYFVRRSGGGWGVASTYININAVCVGI